MPARTHLVQMDIAWEDPAANFDRVRRMVSGAGIARGDLVVLPEMYATGFSLQVERTADEDGAQARFLRELAAATGATVMGGITIRGAAKARNRAVVCGSAGEDLASYDKIHPFSFGREHEVFEGGTGITTFAWNGLRVMPTICYDLRFPELFRAGLARGAEAFVVIASWPSARREHWRALAVARAIENQAWVFAVNRAGSDPYLEYAGGSLVVDPRGQVVVEAGETETVLSVPCDAAAVRTWREEFPAWRDGRLGPQAERVANVRE